MNGCGNCRFSDGDRLCRFSPPGPDGWPEVDHDDWCGKWSMMCDTCEGAATGPVIETENGYYCQSCEQPYVNAGSEMGVDDPALPGELK